MYGKRVKHVEKMVAETLMQQQINKTAQQIKCKDSADLQFIFCFIGKQQHNDITVKRYGDKVKNIQCTAPLRSFILISST